MDRNLLIAFALSFLVLALWSSLQPPPQRDTTPSEATAPAPDEGAPAWQQETAQPAAPAPTEVLQPQGETVVPPGEPVAAATPPETEQAVQIQTPLYDATLTTRGGGLLQWVLKEYRETRDPDSPPLVLTTFDPARNVGLATPFEELGLGNLEQAPYTLESPDSNTVVFTRQQGEVTLRKTYFFEPDSYLFRLRVDIENRSSRTLETRLALRWPGANREGSDFQEHGLTALSDGSVERTRWAMPAAMACAGAGGGSEEQLFETDVEWIGEETRYFLAVMIPELPRNAQGRFVPGADDESGMAEVAYRPISLPPGQDLSREYRVYIGPKLPDRLDAAGAGLAEAINIGWSWVSPLSRFFAWLLSVFYGVIPNYGVAIILITIGVRVATAPLMQKQMKSMAKMRELQPKLKELQEKYGDDKQRQSQEMMNLYKQAGVNPLGGCLPMLLQFPVFIGLYYALQASIDLRQAPFVSWIDDLSTPETLFMLPGIELPVRVLPILMGVSMIAQQKLTPTTMDPAQARMMMTVMPIMFTLLFYAFPSGLVLYWFVSNLLAIGHQLWVNRGMAATA